MQDDQGNTVERTESVGKGKSFAEDRVKKITARAFKLIYTELIAGGISDTDIVFLVSTDAADAAGNALLRDLPTHGVRVTK